MKWSINMFFRAFRVKFLIGLFMLAHTSSVWAAYIGPELGKPEYTVTDPNNVNVAGSAISFSMNDLSIGSGELALRHSISINHNDLLNFESLIPGYKEKYQGGIRRIEYGKELLGTSGPANLPVFGETFYVISVFDHVDTTQFIVNADGEFEGLQNQLSTLTVEGQDTFLLTKPDGTEVRFAARSPIPVAGGFSTDYEARGYMREIKYPNGFAITIHQNGEYLGAPITSVNSNNGLQLKYIYEHHSRPLAASKLSATNNPDKKADSRNWSPYHPVKIIALNNAVESCPLLSISCSPQQEWPEVNYVWPDGMPRDFYVGESVFTVTNAEGYTTEFHSKALSKGLKYGDSGGVILSGLVNEYYPRIVSIKKSSGSEINYGYINATTATFILPFTQRSLSQAGVLYKATQNNKTTSYRFGQLMNEYQTSGSKKMIAASDDFYQGVQRVIKTNVNLGKGKIVSSPFIIETWDKNIYLTEDFASQVERIENKLNDTATDYEYDNKGRVISANDAGRVKSFVYGVSYCNSKTCNRPSAVSDGHNTFLGDAPLYTHYDYLSTTGQVTLVRKPAVSHKIPAVRYYYGNKYARYKKDNASIQNAATPISLLTSKIHCKDSSLSGASCSGGDKVTTTYNYGTGTSANNLFLIGETMTTQGESEVYRTCYKYDKYGNQIGITQPKAGVADCNVGREY
jgi:hypothetical protein